MDEPKETAESSQQGQIDEKDLEKVSGGATVPLPGTKEGKFAPIGIGDIKFDGLQTDVNVDIRAGKH